MSNQSSIATSSPDLKRKIHPYYYIMLILLPYLFVKLNFKVSKNKFPSGTSCFYHFLKTYMYFLLSIPILCQIAYFFSLPSFFHFFLLPFSFLCLPSFLPLLLFFAVESLSFYCSMLTSLSPCHNQPSEVNWYHSLIHIHIYLYFFFIPQYSENSDYISRTLSHQL